MISPVWRRNENFLLRSVSELQHMEVLATSAQKLSPLKKGFRSKIFK